MALIKKDSEVPSYAIIFMGDSKTWDRDWDRDHGRGRGLSYFNKAVFGLKLTLTLKQHYLKKDIPQPRTQPQPDFF